MISTTRASASGRAMRSIFVRDADDYQTVFRLRYDVYVAEQGKAYTQADHDERLLRDDADDYRAYWSQ